MSCYFGCATTVNQRLWAWILAFFAIFWTLLLIPWINFFTCVPLDTELPGCRAALTNRTCTSSVGKFAKVSVNTPWKLFVFGYLQISVVSKSSTRASFDSEKLYTVCQSLIWNEKTLNLTLDVHCYTETPHPHGKSQGLLDSILPAWGSDGIVAIWLGTRCWCLFIIFKGFGEGLVLECVFKSETPALISTLSLLIRYNTLKTPFYNIQSMMVRMISTTATILDLTLKCSASNLLTRWPHNPCLQGVWFL